MRKFGISSELEASILSLLNERKCLDSPQKLSESILKLSDFFIHPDSKQTPWSLSGAQDAYASYFLPLGVARAAAAVKEGVGLNFFEGLESYIDFGSGPGTMSFALQNLFETGTCVESSPAAISLHKALSQKKITWLPKMSDYKKSSGKTLLSMSYSLNELESIPNWVFDFDALMVLEPSTQKDFVRLAELRASLIEKGWHIWAPCPHNLKCPLSGGRDWCHDRVEFEKPKWWDKIEENLPIKNRTITYSYLLARKDQPVNIKKDMARLVGDQLVENGKTRQMVCRGPDREFVSWLHKEGPAPLEYRGSYILVPTDTEKRGNELRIKREKATN